MKKIGSSISILGIIIIFAISNTWAQTVRVASWARGIVEITTDLRGIDETTIRELTKLKSEARSSEGQFKTPLADLLIERFPFLETGINHANMSKRFFNRLLEFTIEDKSEFTGTTPVEGLKNVLGIMMIFTHSQREISQEEFVLANIFYTVKRLLTHGSNGTDDSRASYSFADFSLDIGRLFGKNGLLRASLSELNEVNDALRQAELVKDRLERGTGRTYHASYYYFDFLFKSHPESVDFIKLAELLEKDPSRFFIEASRIHNGKAPLVEENKASLYAKILDSINKSHGVDDYEQLYRDLSWILTEVGKPEFQANPEDYYNKLAERERNSRMGGMGAARFLLYNIKSNRDQNFSSLQELADACRSAGIGTTDIFLY